MVFAYSKEAVGRLERDVCAARARIRELEAALARKDAALAAADKMLAVLDNMHMKLGLPSAYDYEGERVAIAYRTNETRALIAAALKEEEVKR